MMNPLSKLNFPAFPFRVKESEKGRLIWDDQRKIWLVLTPEEWVRRHLICFLISNMKIDGTRIAQEYIVEIGGAAQRADVVVFGKDSKPLLLAECKSPDVAIDRTTLDQAVRYNSVVCAKYIMLTNGTKHYFYTCTEKGEYTPMDNLPDISNK